MSLNQYAVYQLKADPAIRPLRYKTYQYLMENHLRVDADRYHQVYLTTMIGEQSPEQIRKQLERKLPPKFMGSALNVSDVESILVSLLSLLVLPRAMLPETLHHIGLILQVLRVSVL